MAIYRNIYIINISIFMDMAQNEVRVTMPKELKHMLEQRAKSLGLKAPAYIRSLIIEDFKKEIKKV